MKICMFVRNPISNDPRVKREAEHLVRAGHAVTVIGRPGPGLPRRETWHGVQFLRIPRIGERTIEIFKRIVRRPAKASSPVAAPPAKPERRPATAIGKLIARLGTHLVEMTYRIPWVIRGLLLKADAYHAHDLHMLQAAHLCAKIGHAKLVYDSHELCVDWLENKCGAHPGCVELWAKVEAKLAPLADLVITGSGGIADELERMYGIRRPLVVRNCAPLGPAVASDKLRELIGGDAGRAIILFIGGFIDGKGLYELTAAADMVPEADFVFIGPESPAKEGIRNAARAAKHGNVFVLPFIPVDELPEYTSSADAGVALIQPVCKSYELSACLKIHDYLMAGLPIIASPIDYHRRLGEETGAVLLVDPFDPGDIARGIRELVRDPERRRKMGARAREWAEKKYNALHELEKLTAAYHKLGGSSGGS